MLRPWLAQVGLFLTPKQIGHAELTLGGADDTKFKGPLTFITQPSSNGNWMLPSSGIAVNGKTSSTLTSNRTIIFDSGTSNLCFSKATTEVKHVMYEGMFLICSPLIAGHLRHDIS
jgi:Eukaryotic aspartyl protease